MLVFFEERSLIFDTVIFNFWNFWNFVILKVRFMRLNDLKIVLGFFKWIVSFIFSLIFLFSLLISCRSGLILGLGDRNDAFIQRNVRTDVFLFEYVLRVWGLKWAGVEWKHFLSGLIVRRGIKRVVLVLERLFLKFESIFKGVKIWIYIGQCGLAFFGVDFGTLVDLGNLAEFLSIDLILFFLIFWNRLI